MKTKNEHIASIVRQLSDIRSELAERYTVKRIGVFGSLARGDDHFSSDVDIIVDFSDPTFDHYMDLKFHLEEIFKRPVDLVVAGTLKPRLKPIVEQEIVYA